MSTIKHNYTFEGSVSLVVAEVGGETFFSIGTEDPAFDVILDSKGKELINESLGRPVNAISPNTEQRLGQIVWQEIADIV